MTYTSRALTIAGTRHSIEGLNKRKTNPMSFPSRKEQLPVVTVGHGQQHTGDHDSLQYQTGQSLSECPSSSAQSQRSNHLKPSSHNHLNPCEKDPLFIPVRQGPQQSGVPAYCQSQGDKTHREQSQQSQGLNSMPTNGSVELPFRTAGQQSQNSYNSASSGNYGDSSH